MSLYPGTACPLPLWNTMNGYVFECNSLHKLFISTSTTQSVHIVIVFGRHSPQFIHFSYKSTYQNLSMISAFGFLNASFQYAIVCIKIRHLTFVEKWTKWRKTMEIFFYFFFVILQTHIQQFHVRFDYITNISMHIATTMRGIEKKRR